MKVTDMKKVLLFAISGALLLALGGVFLAMNSPKGISEGRGMAMALMGGIVGGTVGLCVGLAREAMRSK
jgi:hypothetical protein